jgi:dUTP pyrophosphatase
MGTITIAPGSKVKIDTGLRIAIPEGYGGFVLPRSGLGTKYEVRLANTVGLIDPGYRGNVFVFIKNGGDDPVTIDKYDRFAQLVITKVNTDELCVVPTLPASDRHGGFGHTGVK